MKIYWRRKAIQSLTDLDNWRITFDLPKIGRFLQKNIENYFKNQDLSVYIPGKTVFIKGLPIELRMALLSVGQSEPYKIYYRLTSGNVEISLLNIHVKNP